MAEPNTGSAATQQQPRQPPPMITPPPRSSFETLFTGGPGPGPGFGPGFSPGPMTMVSNFFSDHYPDVVDYRSFSHLLAGAMASPASQIPPVDDSSNQSAGFKQNRPGELVISQSPSGFVLPSVFSPSGFLNSPAGFLSPIQSPFGMSHQQALAHVTAQAAISQSYLDQSQPENQPSATKPSDDQLQMVNAVNASQELDNSQTGSPDEPSVSQPDISEPQQKSSVNADTNDVYNWRKYGQKQVKAGEHSRGYYKCTHVNCPAKKQVGQSRDGHITDIVYKGKHNHDPPQPSKRAREGADVNKQNNYQVENRVAENQLLALDGPEDEPNSKRRTTEAPPAPAPVESTLSNKMSSEHRIVVQTRSEVDLLDDGFKWRKYGQKIVKGNTNPRSYYKCTYAGCNVRKHVERAPLDPKSVVTTYEGKHNHDIPVSRHRGYSNNGGGQAGKSTKPLQPKGTKLGSNNGRSDLLQMKEEVITV